MPSTIADGQAEHRHADILLLVDDDPTDLGFLYQTLDGQGSRLLVANDGEQALALARSSRPKPVLILLDIILPDVDGFTVCSRIKRDPQLEGISVIFLSALDNTMDKVKGLEMGAVDYITKPFQPEEVIARVNTHLKIKRLEKDLANRNAELEALNQKLEQKVRERSSQLIRGRDAVIFGLAKLADTRDNETGLHLDRMCRFVELLAIQLESCRQDLDGAWIEIIRTAAALHDVGKIGIPDAVLHKASKLSAQERQIMNRHPEIGGETLKALEAQWGRDPFLRAAADIARSHHERWDGSGYPAGLSRDAIPLAARIVALADVYDALTSKRRYKEPWPHEQARNYIIENSGRQFDPEIVHAFLEQENEFRRTAEALQEGNET